MNVEKISYLSTYSGTHHHQVYHLPHLGGRGGRGRGGEREGERGREGGACGYDDYSPVQQLA